MSFNFNKVLEEYLSFLKRTSNYRIMLKREIIEEAKKENFSIYNFCFDNDKLSSLNNYYNRYNMVMNTYKKEKEMCKKYNIIFPRPIDRFELLADYYEYLKYFNRNIYLPQINLIFNNSSKPMHNKILNLVWL